MTDDNETRPQSLSEILSTTQSRILVSVAVAIIIVLLVALPFFDDLGKPTTTYSRLLMGTVVEITLRGDEGEEAAKAAFGEIARLESIFSSYIPTSEVSRLSAAAGEGPQPIGPEVGQVLSTALAVAEASGGAFDPTVGVLKRVWDFTEGSEYVPGVGEVEALLELVDYRKIRLHSDRDGAGGVSAEIGSKDMSLDLGGVAKGYIVGKAADLLKKKGIGWSIIKAGGDLWAQGDGGAPFTIGVRHPRSEGAMLGTISFDGGAVATSGDYERFFEKDGTRYHHILDPATGYPAARSMSVTVISKDPALADAYSTALFVMGPELGLELVRLTDGVEAVFVGVGGEVTVSEGLQERFKAM